MPTRMPRGLAALLSLVFLAVLIRTAWISDDALITLRTVLNVTHGFGLTFNIAERVQTFTHPLWAFLLTLSYLFLNNLYLGTFFLSISVSLVAYWIAVTRAVSFWQAVTVATVLLFSRAFIDFSTSGLENPLSCLLLGLFVGVQLAPAEGGQSLRQPSTSRLRTLALLGSLLYLSRPDDVLLVGPMLCAEIWRCRREGVARVLGAVAVGLLPALLWTVFSLVYYGFPLPNTAYAKLGTGIAQRDLAKQGLIYLFDSIDRDPITLVTIAFAIVVAMARGTSRVRLLAAGVVLYLLYVVSIGGDFMSGRFFAVPLFAAVLILGQWPGATKPTWIAAALVLAAVGSTSAHVPLLSDSRFDDPGVRATGVTDERGVFFQNRSLVRATRVTMSDPDWPRASNTRVRTNVVRTCGLLGAGGLDWGPYRYWLDECALADPLLARLPSVFTLEWRTAHFRRFIPDGYEDSLATDSNVIKDPQLHRYYDDVRLITRSSRLFSAERWKAIVRINTGRDGGLIDRAFYRHSGVLASIDDFATIVPDDQPANAPGVRPLPGPLAVTVADRKGRRYLDIAVTSDLAYRLTFLRRDAVLGSLDVGPIPEYRRKPGMTSFTVDLPPRATDQGFDTIVVAPHSDEKPAAIGHMLLDGEPATAAELHRRVAIRDGATAP